MGDVISLAATILLLLAPLLALPSAIGGNLLARRASIWALFVVPLVGEMVWFAVHWKGGAVALASPIWLAFPIYYPLAVIWIGFWTALAVAVFVRLNHRRNSNSRLQGTAASRPFHARGRV